MQDDTKLSKIVGNQKRYTRLFCRPFSSFMKYSSADASPGDKGGANNSRVFKAETLC